MEGTAKAFSLALPREKSADLVQYKARKHLRTAPIGLKPQKCTQGTKHDDRDNGSDIHSTGILHQEARVGIESVRRDLPRILPKIFGAQYWQCFERRLTVEVEVEPQ